MVSDGPEEAGGSSIVLSINAVPLVRRTGADSTIHAARTATAQWRLRGHAWSTPCAVVHRRVW